jgi:membrane carboxypeptidase/penicillin-binding protein PbpC
MNPPRLLVLLAFLGFVPFASAKDANPVFGYYEAIVYDTEMLQGVKVNESTGDVFIMFQPDKTDTQLTLKMSMAEGAQYRKWFTDEEVLVAQENHGRAPNTWTDRVQTSANYIEYHANGKIFLHLKRLKG